MKIERTMQLLVKVTITADSEATFWARLAFVKHYLRWFLSVSAEMQEGRKILAKDCSGIDVKTDTTLKESITA